MGFLDWFRSKAARGGPGGTTVAWRYGISSPPPRRGTRELFQAYRTSAWLRAVESRIANECASAVKLRLYDGPEDDDQRKPVAPGDPRYELMRLLRRPVRVASGQVMTARQRNKILALWYGLAGEAFIVKQRGPSGRVTGLVPLSPLWVRGTPTPEQPFYTVQVDGQSPETRIAPGDVIPIVDLDAENPYGRGVGTAAALGDELDCEEGLATMAKALALNRGVPETLVLLEKATTASQVEEARRGWRERFGGPERAGQVEFIGGTAQVVQLGMKVSDSQLIEQRRFLRDTIIQVHGVSPEIFGVLEQSTRDSIDSAYYLLGLGVLVPWLDALCDAYQSHLVPEFGTEDDLWLSYKSPIPENRALQINAMSIAPSAFRVRDLREVGGFAPDPERGSEAIASEQRIATPTQLPAGKGADPQWALALAATVPGRSDP